MEGIKIFNTEFLPENDLNLLIKKLLNEGERLNRDENIRLTKLLQEGKTEAVYQILSHRMAVASVKNQNLEE